MKPYHEGQGATLHHGDCLDVLPTLPAESVDLVLADPPYFRVKSETWDRQWGSATEFMGWLGRVADELRRVLKPNGSLYLFASVKMAAHVEVMLGERFTVLNSIRWAKPCSRADGSDKDALRAYFSASEAIIFCEQQGADSMALGESGYAAQCERLRGFVFEPLRAYLRGEWQRAGLNRADARLATGAASMSGHYFAKSQWALPTAEHYAAMQRYANRGGGAYLRREYEDLRREYEDLRRPFAVSPDVPYTDVWTFPTVQAYPGKHPCEKPLGLLTHAIQASSKSGAVVLDAFAGGGSSGRAALLAGRKWIGIEKDASWCASAAAALAQPHRAQVRRAPNDETQLGLGW